MRTPVFASIVFGILASFLSANAVTDTSHSKTLVVQSPSTLPVLAQKNSEAMYCTKTATVEPCSMLNRRMAPSLPLSM